MKWTKLPKGVFTDIDWSRPGVINGVDPYLIWAEIDKFAGYGDKMPQWLPIALEITAATSISQLVDAASEKWLRVPPVYTSTSIPAGLSFCTAKVRPAFFKHVQPGGSLHALVKRFELGLPAGIHTADPELPLHPAITTSTTPAPLLKGKVIGLIDDGLAFANANFLRQGKARTAHFWRQDGKGVGHISSIMGYGHEIGATAIDQAMARHTYHGLVDESAVYREFGLFRLEKPASHGTHVLDLAAGPRKLRARIASPDAPPSWAAADDDASRAPIVAVQLDWDTIRDTSGGSLNVAVMDAIAYIVSRCAPDAKLAINLSWGTLAGPHDGTSLIEAAMDQFIELRKGGLEIVVPAGNSYQSRTHANATLKKNEHLTLHWRGQPEDSTQNFVELWMGPGHDGLEIEVTPPGHNIALPPLKLGESGMWTNNDGTPLLALIYQASTALGNKGACALLAVAPTFSFKKNFATAPSGVWKIRITNRHKNAATFDAYVQRDDDPLQLATGARQSHFEDTMYDTSGNPDAWVDHPDNPTPIRRSGNFNSIATGRHTVSVGGTRLSDGSWAWYSPCKPDPDHARPGRPGVVKVPKAHEVTDENEALQGVSAAGTRSVGVVRLRGTSDAAPQRLRKILNAM